ncbi:hypothetical protein BDV19DRAFT_231512 [Aspergillus venezuelensis]
MIAAKLQCSECRRVVQVIDHILNYISRQVNSRQKSPSKDICHDAVLISLCRESRGKFPSTRTERTAERREKKTRSWLIYLGLSSVSLVSTVSMYLQLFSRSDALLRSKA